MKLLSPAYLGAEYLAEHVIAFLRAHDTSYCFTVAHDG